MQCPHKFEKRVFAAHFMQGALVVGLLLPLSLMHTIKYLDLAGNLIKPPFFRYVLGSAVLNLSHLFLENSLPYALRIPKKYK